VEDNRREARPAEVKAEVEGETHSTMTRVKPPPPFGDGEDSRGCIGGAAPAARKPTIRKTSTRRKSKCSSPRSDA
jgi:hypothetical protein